jgi:hypothetical protein
MEEEKTVKTLKEQSVVVLEVIHIEMSKFDGKQSSKSEISH